MCTVTDPLTVQELMTPKEQKAVVPSPQRQALALPQQTAVPSGERLENPIFRNRGGARDALGVYTSNPKSIPKELRVYDSDEYVVIRDLYPKASIHLLLLFKSPRNVLHPFHFFEDPDVLAKAREELKGIRHMVAKELERKFGKYSAQDRKRQTVLHGEITLADGEELPEGRDWESEIMVGIHARPSMNHVHVHIISRDLFSSFVSKRAHYQSFTTRFFVNLDEFPLAADDPRWEHHGTDAFIKADFVCWRCKRNNFKNMPDLKKHLADEFDNWRAE